MAAFELLAGDGEAPMVSFRRSQIGEINPRPNLIVTVEHRPTCPEA